MAAARDAQVRARHGQSASGLKLQLTGTPSAQLQEQRQLYTWRVYVRDTKSKRETRLSPAPELAAATWRNQSHESDLRNHFAASAEIFQTGTEGMPKRQQSKFHMACTFRRPRKQNAETKDIDKLPEISKSLSNDADLNQGAKRAVSHSDLNREKRLGNLARQNADRK